MMGWPKICNGRRSLKMGWGVHALRGSSVQPQSKSSLHWASTQTEVGCSIIIGCFLCAIGPPIRGDTLEPL
jgi:hypothetical protein